MPSAMRPAGASSATRVSRYASDTHWTAASGAVNSRSIGRKVRVTMLASSWPMNAPKQTTPTASQGARGLRLMAAGRAASAKVIL
jgi:hypothetical protein